MMCTVASSTVLWRLCLRLANRTFGADDYAIIFALICYIGWSTLAIYINLHAGVGKPLWEVTYNEFVLWNKGAVICTLIYPVMSMSIRVSIPLFYRRIIATPGSRRSFQITMYALLALQFVYLVVFSVVPAVTICNPLASIAAAYKLGIYVWDLRIFTDVDLVWLQYEMSRLVPPEYADYGKTFWILSMMEPTLALICASLPVLRPALIRVTGFISSTFASTFGTKKSSGNASSTGDSWKPSAPRTKGSRPRGQEPYFS
ncbi:hypothetical protein QBC46DRAFT_413039 [Diplogelasinospora grovesii]|uniref:Rhodopsin domain-containing protein n=1 Tax=Diplogelasinospora grovesii TaxID=303347 RepID=A0AAN6MYT0_9PEZI|nr:hypothetical protein QBC46DRAFT_413039 [Diplogelasinospora grovesii]